MISGAGLCWQHVGGVGSTTTTTSLWSLSILVPEQALKSLMWNLIIIIY